MSIRLGNIPPKELQDRLGVKFSDEDLAFLEKHYQHDATIKYNTCEPVYHTFDIPLSIMASCRDLAAKIHDIMQKYDMSNAKHNEFLTILYCDISEV